MIHCYSQQVPYIEPELAKAGPLSSTFAQHYASIDSTSSVIWIVVSHTQLIVGVKLDQCHWCWYSFESTSPAFFFWQIKESRKTMTQDMSHMFTQYYASIDSNSSVIWIVVSHTQLIVGVKLDQCHWCCYSFESTSPAFFSVRLKKAGKRWHKICRTCFPWKRLLFIRHRWEGEMGWSQHKSPHQAWAFRRGLNVVNSAEISPYRCTNDVVCVFSYEYLSETAKANYAVKRMRECEIGWYVS